MPKTEISWFQISHLMNLYLKLKKAGIKKRKFIVSVSGEHEVDVECETRDEGPFPSLVSRVPRPLLALREKLKNKTKQNSRDQ